MEIAKGKVNRAQRVTLYGPEGIGKSTIGSLFPNPVFMDVERGTDHLDVSRTPVPVSFEMVRQITASLTQDNQGFATFVVDTADWCERLATEEVCSKNSISSLGGAKDYGRSYNMLEQAWAKWMDMLTELCYTKGVHVVVLAHAMMRKFEQPEESGAFDRWEMKLNQKKTAPVLKEWSDMVLFLGYKTLVVEDEQSKSRKGKGGHRVIRTAHHPCWDAKNRHGLPSEIELNESHKGQLPTELLSIFYQPASQPQKGTQQPQATPQSTPQSTPKSTLDGGVPGNLVQLMVANNVTEEEIRRAVASRGTYPFETPINNYEPEYISGVLVAAWPKVLAVINEQRAKGGNQ